MCNQSRATALWLQMFYTPSSLLYLLSLEEHSEFHKWRSNLRILVNIVIIDFRQHSSCIENSGNVFMMLPNEWFFIKARDCRQIHSHIVHVCSLRVWPWNIETFIREKGRPKYEELGIVNDKCGVDFSFDFMKIFVYSEVILWNYVLVREDLIVFHYLFWLYVIQ